MQTGRLRIGTPQFAQPSRLGTGSMGTSVGSRRMTDTTQARAASGVGVGLNTQVEVTDRPFTKEGMMGMKTRGGPARQVQDKSFYMSALRSKINEILLEIQKMKQEEEKIKQDAQQMEGLNSKKSKLETEVQNLKGQFDDLNLAIQQLHEFEDTDVIEEVKRLRNELRAKNEAQTHSNNQIFKERKQIEDEMSSLKEKANQLHLVIQNKLGGENNEKRKMYFSLKEEKLRLQKEIENQELELREFVNKNEKLEQQIQDSKILFKLEEKMDLETKIFELQKRYQVESGEGKDEISASLIAQVKEDKEEILRLQNEIQNEKVEMDSINSEMIQLKKQLGFFTGEQANRYKELKEKEKVVDEFIGSFDSLKEEDHNTLKEHQSIIVKLLEHISTGIKNQESIPASQEAFSELQNDLQFKTDQKKMAQNTLQSLEVDLQTRKKELEKMNHLDTKIEQDLKNHRQKIEEMKSDLILFGNLDTFKQEMEKEKLMLTEKRENITKIKETMKQQMHLLTRQYETIKKKLSSNDIHTIFTDLHQKIQIYEQNNFTLQEFIQSKGLECDYRESKSNSLQLMQECNRILKSH